VSRTNFSETFHALGFEFDTKSEPYELLFDEVQLRESAGFPGLCFVTLPWTSYQTDDVLFDSVGSPGLREPTSRQCLSASLIMDLDIFRCWKMQKWHLASVCVRIRAICMLLDSLMRLSSSPCSILDRLLFLSRVMAVSFPVSVLERPSFDTCLLFDR
jgi:hypothetical protein